MTEAKDKRKFDWTKIFIGISLLLCACSLAFISVSLRPVAKWANYQSVCVEQESIKAPISWAVRKCNGRSKVYQVK
ncbi:MULTISPECIES: hypothetical protein [Prochlorococcus]|uniref:Uncharacterized protein n=1 Tax=Prochlorococcus marinus (strain SARG / CCMP1375 / SS120) TaxID=167539 RepID=Q7VAI1_PROMA|nr:MULTISPECIES: hypothetical protein [Prochlorococcus]AAQ00525.1 Predicted protein [Prochlorococcus marinus subsp. marinus str. CCMP1375]KGG10305.1 hypothetical protein EV04_1971 [Prochlorococcus marinus str. LG]KGG22608.1 hypothetical protein EV08_0023 [Prochlorococcus marinus str. SS2]KGG24239.1 hypothetical protein EV09_0846 [Prochlorococcus marinus str. SS35]KGG33148.1 hypothetical protein EV10_0781 [Prochlorococcus marinus str. SS51]